MRLLRSTRLTPIAARRSPKVQMPDLDPYIFKNEAVAYDTTPPPLPSGVLVNQSKRGAMRAETWKSLFGKSQTETE